MKKKKKIKVALLGVGNCASSFVQGVCFYSQSPNLSGAITPSILGLSAADIEFVAAIDVDKRKVGHPLNRAIYANPNNTIDLCPKALVKKNVPSKVIVHMGRILDGVSEEMIEQNAFLPSKQHREATEKEIVSILKTADVLVNYLPVGSQEATEFYMTCALKAGTSVVNAIPVFIASNPIWEKRFKKEKLAIIGDDIKSQLGATILHRAITSLCLQRGIEIQDTYQLNVGGNTDFLNMKVQSRLLSKKRSKTAAVQSTQDENIRDIHIGPSDHVPYLHDRKICYINLNGAGFAGAPIEIEVKLSVVDSPNSAGVILDAVRLCYLAQQAGVYGSIDPVSAFYMKHPRKQSKNDETASKELKKFMDLISLRLKR